MKNIRKSVFETNSSSTHSIVLDRRVENEWAKPKRKFVAQGGEFAWEIKAYDKWEDKLNYLAAFLTFAGYPEISEFQEILQEAFFDYSGFNLEIKLSSGSYFDHQSTAIARHVFESGKEFIKEFIFNPAYILVTGNDNTGETYFSTDSEGNLDDPELTLIIQ